MKRELAMGIPTPRSAADRPAFNEGRLAPGRDQRPSLASDTAATGQAGPAT